MTLNTSLRSRVRRLELRQDAADRPSVGQLLRECCLRLAAMTPAQADAHLAASDTRCRAALGESDAPQGPASIVQQARWRIALAAMSVEGQL